MLVIRIGNEEREIRLVETIDSTQYFVLKNEVSSVSLVEAVDDLCISLYSGGIDTLEEAIWIEAAYLSETYGVWTFDEVDTTKEATRLTEFMNDLIDGVEEDDPLYQHAHYTVQEIQEIISTNLKYKEE
ncbi:hypothetical protein EJP02_100 [Escherichia phage EJP2]|nr:hypothetical protein EJP02_100 [Escherichia phage EJP2]